MITLEKELVRRDILTARNSLGNRLVVDKSKVIVERLMGLQLYAAVNTIMTYLDYRNEVKTDWLVRMAMSDGKRVTVPVVNKKEKTMLPSQLEKYPEDLITGSYGILEPRTDKIKAVAPEDLDLVIVPGVAFDQKGNRMGYGGGFYDRFLPRLRQGAVTVALAFELQILPDLSPVMGCYDQPVQYILTENRIINCQ